MESQIDNSQRKFDITAYCVQHYKQAIFTAVFSFIKGYGELIFASLEFVPNFLGFCHGMDDEQQLPFKERRVFFVRHAIDDVAGALEMFREATQSGQVLMPWQKGAPIDMLPYKSDSNIAQDREMFLEREENDFPSESTLVYFPRLETPLYFDKPPFRSAIFRGALASHVMLNGRNRSLEKYLRNETVLQWVEKRLMWPLHENLAYLGSFSCIFPNPYYGHLNMRLIPQPHDGKDVVRMMFDRDCSHNGLVLQLEERVSSGLGPMRSLPIDSRSIIDVKLTGYSDEVGYKVLDKDGRIIDCHDFASFIRGIQMNFFLIKPRKKKRHLGGSTVPLPNDGIQFTGNSEEEGDVPELQLQKKHAVFQFAREAKEKANFQYLYFNQREAAERKIWEIVTLAREKVTIVDPYFSISSIEDFIEDLSDQIEVAVCCSSGALEDKNSNEPGKRLLTKMEELVGKGRKITIEVVGHKHVHDRFVIVDGRESWLLGSSVETLGKSLSAIIKLENGQDVSDRLLEYLKNIPNKKTLKEWLKISDADRTRAQKALSVQAPPLENQRKDSNECPETP